MNKPPPFTMEDAERAADAIAELEPEEMLRVLARLLMVVAMDVEQEPRERPVWAAYNALMATGIEDGSS